MPSTKERRNCPKRNFFLPEKDKKIGQNIFRKFLETERGYTLLYDCEDNTFDQTYIKNGKIEVFELKTDYTHMINDDNTGEIADTKNIVIEFKSIDKMAKFFVTYFPQINELWLIRTEKLKKLIEEEKYNFQTIKTGDNITYLTNRIEIKSEFSITNVCKEEIVVV